MDGVGYEALNIKRDSVAQRFMKLPEALGRIDEFNTQLESKINELEALSRGTKTSM
jgi:hypothetical protein